MRKVLISRSPILIIVLAVIAAAAILLPHDINTANVDASCADNTLCTQETEQTTMRIGFPYVWKTNIKTVSGDENIKTTTANTKKLYIDIIFWLVLILFIGLFPIKIDIDENNRY